MSHRVKICILFASFVVSAAAMLFMEPISQEESYHDFADRRTILGIPNFCDVFSNIPFAVVGVAGLIALRKESMAYTVFFVGVTFVSVGSAYYHLQPTTQRLFWDRLPMTVAFMSLFAATIGERISASAGKILLFPFCAVGIMSILYWNWTGDLRIYGLVQYYTMFALILILLLMPSGYSRGNDLWIALMFYAISKVLEALDKQVFAAGGVVSGHSLKHIAAAAATYWILRMISRRQPI